MSHSETDSIFQILRDIATDEKEETEKKSPQSKLIRRLYIETVIFPFIIAVVIGISMKSYDKLEWLNTVGLSALGIAYLGLLVLQFILIDGKTLFKTVQHPLLKLLSYAETTTHIDTRYLGRLISKDKEHLQIVLLEMASEKEASEKSIGLLIGAIDKVGLFPGILSLFVLILRIDQAQHVWLYSIAYTTPLLYVFGLHWHSELSRMNRLCKLLENVLQFKEGDTRTANCTKVCN